MLTSVAQIVGNSPGPPSEGSIASASGRASTYGWRIAAFDASLIRHRSGIGVRAGANNANPFTASQPARRSPAAITSRLRIARTFLPMLVRASLGARPHTVRPPGAEALVPG